MKVAVCVPSTAVLDVDDLSREVANAPIMRPFSEEAMNLLLGLSDVLLHDRAARQHPELVAFGFWLRRTELDRLRSEFDDLNTLTRRLLPRGTVFQIAPANVDTLFAYSWTFALLTGNRSIVRLSSRSSDATGVLCSHIAKLLSEYGELRRSHVFVRYGHDRKITEALSRACDVRVIWGGDTSVNSIREIPLPTHAKELSFRDRYSLCAISAREYLVASDAVKLRLAHGFFNDSYSFDQMACSSPRLVIWCGPEEQCREAAHQFFEELQKETERREYSVEPSVRVRKFVCACEMVMDGTASTCTQNTPNLMVLELGSLQSLSREQCGGGMFLQCSTPSLRDVAPYTRRSDQTLVYFGFRRDELEQFLARATPGAIDRIVPIGQALSFNRHWDGYDFLQELTRSVVIH